MNILKTVYVFFDKLEDHVRAWLSRRPILYGIVAGLGAVLFFRGMWMIIDETNLGAWESIALSLAILLITGTFVSHFVSDDLITSGLSKQKKIIDKTENELADDVEALHSISKEIKKMKREVEKIRKDHAAE